MADRKKIVDLLDAFPVQMEWHNNAELADYLLANGIRLETKQATSDKTSDKSKRLIDANALIDYIDEGHLRNPLQICFSEHDVVNMVNGRPTVDAIPVSAEELRHLINDTLAYIWKMESDGRENLTDSRKALLEKLKRFAKEHFPEFACSYGERNTNG